MSCKYVDNKVFDLKINANLTTYMPAYVLFLTD